MPRIVYLYCYFYPGAYNQSIWYSLELLQTPLAQTPPHPKQKERKHSQTEKEIFMSNFVF